MAILVQRFTVVVVAGRVAQTYDDLVEVARGLGGFSWCTDGELVGAHFYDRHGFRGGLERLRAMGIEDAGGILEATEVDPDVRLEKEERAARIERLAATRDVALLTPRRESVNGWLVLGRGRVGPDGPVVAGCRLAEGGEPGLALPEGWSVADAVPLHEDFEQGDELLPTWHEYLRGIAPDARAWMLAQGPEATLAWWRMLGQDKPFAGVVRESPKVHQEECVVRDPDGTERKMTARWVKF